MTGQAAPEPSRHRRRSQAERRAETVERLLDATIATIAELGYHGATTVEICAHAGVTHGARFHHFDSKIDLVIAALQRMTEQRIGRYVEFAEEIQASAGHPLELLRMVGQLARDDVAIVWAEITVAARTDAELHERVGPAIDSLGADPRRRLSVPRPRRDARTRARRLAAGDARLDRVGAACRAGLGDRRSAAT